jgi:hypothetical protein
MNLLQNFVGAINKQKHSMLNCPLTIAAVGKRNMGSGCWFYDWEMLHYDFVKTPKHFSWPCSFSFIIAKYSSV